jgi:pimeloyl-ACP methyl ester carboxylesterase
MHLISLVFLCLLPYITAQNSTILNSEYPWLRFPPTPQLPSPLIGKYAPINDILIWYTIYGPRNGAPLLFLHGGFGNSDYWGLQVEELKSVYRCILMDSRGQGRSSMSSDDITYDLMTSDVIALLDYLKIEKTHLVGWSDGAIIGLNLAMNYPNRLSALFAFAANYVYTGGKDVFASPVFMAYLARTEAEYETINPINNYPNLYNNLTTMWSISPNWTEEDFAKIDKNLPVWIVDGDHEEAIYRDQPDTMSSWIIQSGELILPRTSHFSFIQIPEGFTQSILRFLNEANCYNCNYTISVTSSSSSTSSIFFCFLLLSFFSIIFFF